MKILWNGQIVLAAAMGIGILFFTGCSSKSSSSTPKPSTGTITLNTATTTVTQATGTVNVTVSRTDSSTGTVAADYTTTDNTAIAGTHYMNTSGKLTWADGDSSVKTIPVRLGTDPFCGTRSFTLTLSNPDGGALLGTASALVNIVGSDNQPGVVEFPSAAATVYQGSGVVTLPVRRHSGSGGAINVSFATADGGSVGDAVSGQDYTFTKDVLTWDSCNSTDKNIVVPISTAAPFTGSRRFSVDLAAPTGGASLGQNSSATVDITGLWIRPSSLPQFDFTNWKLMLPIDSNGGTGGIDGIQFPAKEIQPAEIIAGYVDAYFYADDSGQVIFTAPSNGAVSTPGNGPDHTRSELRELYTGPGAVSKDWNSSIGGTMTATIAIKSIAAESDVVTIGQIHGQDNTFMLLLYRKSKKDVVVDIYAKNPPTTTPPTHTRTPILTGVEMGDTIRYSIQYIGDTITTKAEDVTTQSGEQTDSQILDPSWAGALVYFKVGAYHSVPNTGNNTPGDQTRVAVSAISVSH
ncbi:MAG: polysaccharide lyase family 7 protein [Gammaproteobacteria bacterium]|nr:polysaccharide lyase family 7 protein [Gammaproteobacteria bacterium]